MIEIIDISSKSKLMAMPLANIKYMDDNYIIYCIDRGNNEANIFASKLVLTSEAYTFNNDFKNGEKELLDNIVKKMINKENLTNDNFIINNDIKLNNINYFDIDICYISTTNKEVVKEILIFYNLITEKTLEKPVIDILEEKKIFNEGFISNIFLILFGLIVLITSIVVLVGVFK